MAMAMANHLLQLISQAMAPYLRSTCCTSPKVHSLTNLGLMMSMLANGFKFLLNGQRVGHDFSSAVAEPYIIYIHAMGNIK